MTKELFVDSEVGKKRMMKQNSLSATYNKRKKSREKKHSDGFPSSFSSLSFSLAPKKLRRRKRRRKKKERRQSENMR